MRKVLFAASECVPFVKTGGLADVVGSLPKVFDKSEFDIRVMLPMYECIKDQYKSQMQTVYYFQMDNIVYVGVMKLELDGITYYFIDNKQYFSGSKPYFDLFTDLERFAYFSKAVLSALPLIGFRPDIIHCHDWQSALIPVYLNTVFQGDPFFQGIRTIMTIHNIRFQGTWNVGHLQYVSRLPHEVFEPTKLVSPFQDTSLPKSDWTASMLRGGLVYSDWITTVSNSYAYEIQTPQFSDGLDDILLCRNQRLKGIVNGLDYQIWNPETDANIAETYNIENFIAKRNANKIALQKELGLNPDPSVFTLGIVSRLTDQKGLDLVDQIMDQLCETRMNLVVLGTGDPHYENMFRHYQSKYPNKIAAIIGYSEELSHRIYAGVDALLVPSAFEPCGLTQLISLRYGTVPIVHEIGGLKDTVQPFNQYDNTGTGFGFKGYHSQELMDRINHAMYLFYNDKATWNGIQKRAMEQDWSWKNSCEVYRQLYLGM
ncbi:MAG: glycogen synthase [Sphaerochaetaceae bacterium]|nr:glycogen synthase [Sphaerochaetaceae bacterium]